MTPFQKNLVKVFLPTNQTIDKQNSSQPISNIIEFSNRPTIHPR